MFYNIDLRKTSVVGLLAAAMALVMSFMFVGSVNANDQSDYEWEKIYDGVKITGANSIYGHADIPQKIEGVQVVEIGEYAFQSQVMRPINISSITLPDGLKRIKNHAFQDNKIETLIIPDSVEYIDRNAFSGNPLTGTLVIPDKVTTVGNSAFNYVNLEEVILLNSETKLGSAAFRNKEYPYNSITIKGHSPSTAETYANDNGNTFKKLNLLDSQSIPVGVTAEGGNIELIVDNINNNKAKATIGVTENKMNFSDLVSFDYKLSDSRGSEDNVRLNMSMTSFLHEDDKSIVEKFTVTLGDGNTLTDGSPETLITLDPKENTIHEDSIELSNLSFNETKGKFIKAGKYTSTITLEVENVPGA